MQQQTSFLDLLSGKTCPEPLAATREKTSKPSSKRFVASGGGQDHIVPMPPKDKWTPAGCIVGDGWSVAWRVYDAQYWGVPQRRKRIYLIADFGSERAGEILFECESVRGDFAESEEAREGIAADAQGSAGRSDSVIGCDLYNGQLTGDKAACHAWCKQRSKRESCWPSVCYKADGVKCLNPWDCQSKRQYSVDGVYRTLDAGNCAGGQAHGICYPAAFMGGQGAKARSIAYCDDGSTPTLKSAPSGGNTVPDVVYAVEGNTVDRASNKNGKGYSADVSPTLNTQDKHAVTYAIEGNGQRESHQGDGYAETDKMYTLNTIERHAVCFQQNQRDEVRDMGEQAGALTAEPGMHNQNYLCYPDVAHSLCARHDSSPCIDRGQNFICVQNTGRGWWNEGEIAETLRTPCGGDSTKANLVVAVDCRNMCANEELSATIQAKNGGGHSLNFINPVVYDARGNGGGTTVPTITGDHQNRVSDYTCICVERNTDE